MIPYTYQFLFSLFGTVVIETAVLIILVRLIFKIDQQKIELKVLLTAGVFANLSTISYVWYVIPILTFWNLPLAIAIGEIFAFLMEAIFYEVFLKFNFKRALMVSFLCNISSFILMTPLLKAFILFS